jgi:hypothetical protein
LCAFLGSISRAHFRPGQHDCALFAAGAVQSMTGVDLAAEYRGEYQTIEEGYALMRERGFDGPIEFAESQFEEIPPLFAQVGDLAVVQGDGALALGVVQGPTIYVLRLDGPGVIPLDEAVRAFRV